MTAPLRILAISGSLRRESYNSALLRLAHTLAPDDMTIEIAAIDAIPLYNGDLEADGLPEPVTTLRHRVRTADGLLFAVPEYNYSIPGVLKNVIDWVSRPPDQPFAGKPLALLGGGGGFGTTRSQLATRQVMAALGAITLPKPEVMVPMVWEKFDAGLALKDERVTGQVKDLLAAFGPFVRRLRG